MIIWDAVGWHGSKSSCQVALNRVGKKMTSLCAFLWVNSAIPCAIPRCDCADFQVKFRGVPLLMIVYTNPYDHQGYKLAGGEIPLVLIYPISTVHPQLCCRWSPWYPHVFRNKIKSCFPMFSNEVKHWLVVSNMFYFSIYRE